MTSSEFEPGGGEGGGGERHSVGTEPASERALARNALFLFKVTGMSTFFSVMAVISGICTIHFCLQHGMRLIMPDHIYISVFCR